MTTDYSIPVVWADAIKFGTEGEHEVRIYRASPDTWNLQVRTQIKLASGRNGKDFMIATAALDLTQLRALWQAVDDFLTAEAGGRLAKDLVAGVDHG